MARIKLIWKRARIKNCHKQTQCVINREEGKNINFPAIFNQPSNNKHKTMNTLEHSYSTTESKSDTSEIIRRVPDAKISQLLKLVYYEKKSIKQASKYLKINYNSAKRILKQFRKGKITIEKELEYEERMQSHNNIGLSCYEKMENRKAPCTIDGFLSEFQVAHTKLFLLTREINENQNTLRSLISCAYFIMSMRNKQKINLHNVERE